MHDNHTDKAHGVYYYKITSYTASTMLVYTYRHRRTCDASEVTGKEWQTRRQHVVPQSPLSGDAICRESIISIKKCEGSVFRRGGDLCRVYKGQSQFDPSRLKCSPNVLLI